MPRGNAECFRRVAEASFASWRQKIDLGNNASRMAKLGNVGETLARYESFWKHVPRFARP